MSDLLKRFFLYFVVYVSRFFIRYVPIESVSNFLYNFFYNKYIGWRKLEVLAETSFGARMRLRLPDSIQTKIFLTGMWEPSITKLIASGLRQGDIFIDIGANIGYYTLLASKLVGTNGKIYAFEASPSIFDDLSKNVSLNNASNIILKNIAISNAPGQCVIWTSPEGNLGHSTIMDNVAAMDGHKRESLIECDTILSLVPSDDLLQARFIKMDIEGAEKLALQGIIGSLDSFSSNTEWIVEISPSFLAGGHLDAKWIFEAFIKAGYQAYLIENNYQGMHETHRSYLYKLNTAPEGRLNDVLFTKNNDSKYIT